MNQAMNWVAFLSLLGVGIVSIPSLFQSMPFSSSAPLLSSYSFGAAKLGIPVPYHKKIQEYWDRIKKLGHIDEMIKALGQQLFGGKFGKQMLNAPGKALNKVEGSMKDGVDKMKGAVSNPAGAVAGAVTGGLDKVKGAIPNPLPAIPNPLPAIPNPLPAVPNLPQPPPIPKIPSISKPKIPHFKK